VEKPTVVFVPGFMQRGEAWSPVAEIVGERYPSACLDFAAQTPVAGCVPVGYSMGGRLVLHAAVREPGRFAALVLVGASAGIEDEPERCARRERDEDLADWMAERPIEEVVDRWERTPALAGQAPELVAAQRRGRLAHDPAKLAALLRTAGQGALPPVWDRLAALELPVLAVAGERDEPYVRAAQRMAALLPRGEARLVESAGHAPQLERPDAFAALVLDFLDEHLGESVLVEGNA
jgi:2-succinyl-6-hydroxy-2,4-cyclohexadiene-1-carboxylate synthase